MAFVELCEHVSLDSSTNLWSFTVLKGAYLLLRKSKEDLGEGKVELISNICSLRLVERLSEASELFSKVTEALLANGYQVKVCEVEATWRAIIGVSEDFGKISFEIGLCFDPVLNLPFIPGSTLKGAFRHALEDLVIKHYAGSKDEDKAKLVAQKISSEIFGSNKASGLVGVTDAYPVAPGENGRIFDPEVMTPHYPKAKTELDVKPNPLPFLTIAPGVRFRFAIFFNKEIYNLECNRSINTVHSNNLSPSKQVTSFSDVLNYAIFHERGKDLALAIKEKARKDPSKVDFVPWIDRAVLYAFARGVGAKTALGYSRFKIIKYVSFKGGQHYDD